MYWFTFYLCSTYPHVFPPTFPSFPLYRSIKANDIKYAGLYQQACVPFKYGQATFLLCTLFL